MLRFLILAALLFPTTVSGATFDEIRIDVPARAHLKVRNDFGDVSVEHWEQSYVTVEATIDGAATLTRSPILIDNRGTLVTISVVRRPIDPVVAIHLKLKIPATVEITSWDGKAYVKPSIQTSTEVAPQLVGAVMRAPAGTPDDKPENVEIGEGDIIRVDSQLVTLNISVIDRSTSRGLAGLVQSDFRLFEDGQEQRVVQFESSSAPFDLVLLIDLSGSTKSSETDSRGSVAFRQRRAARRPHRYHYFLGIVVDRVGSHCRPRSAATKN